MLTRQIKVKEEKYVHDYDKLKDMIQILTNKREKIFKEGRK